jgi:hypothetical protein
MSPDLEDIGGAEPSEELLEIMRQDVSVLCLLFYTIM